MKGNTMNHTRINNTAIATKILNTWLAQFLLFYQSIIFNESTGPVCFFSHYNSTGTQWHGTSVLTHRDGELTGMVSAKPKILKI